MTIDRQCDNDAPSLSPNSEDDGNLLPQLITIVLRSSPTIVASYAMPITPLLREGFVHGHHTYNNNIICCAFLFLFGRYCASFVLPLASASFRSAGGKRRFERQHELKVSIPMHTSRPPIPEIFLKPRRFSLSVQIGHGGERFVPNVRYLVL